jgi:hypothetical protein
MIYNVSTQSKHKNGTPAHVASGSVYANDEYTVNTVSAARTDTNISSRKYDCESSIGFKGESILLSRRKRCMQTQVEFHDL